MTSETSHVHLVNDAACGAVLKRSVAFPIIGARVHDDTFHRRGGIIADHAGRVTAIFIGNYDAAAVGVQQNLGGIKAHSVRRIERSISPVGVELPRSRAWHEDMPVGVSAV